MYFPGISSSNNVDTARTRGLRNRCPGYGTRSLPHGCFSVHSDGVPLHSCPANEVEYHDGYVGMFPAYRCVSCELGDRQ